MLFPNIHDKKRRIEVGREWGKRSGFARQKLRDELGVDADTARMHALHDAKGQVVRYGATYRASGVVEWCVRRSCTGTVRQFAFVSNGAVRLTGGRRVFPLRVRP